jgi:hypothetical protein
LDAAFANSYRFQTMRWLVASAGFFVFLPAIATAQPVAPSTVTTVGTVGSLDLSQIRVGGTLCRLTTTKSESLAQSFAVGEHVAMGCAGGALRTISIARLKGPIHSVTYLRSGAPTRPAGAAAAPSTGAVFGGSLTWNVLATGANTVTGSVNVTGPIAAITTSPFMVGGAPTALTMTNITVGSATCSLLSPPSLQLQVGELIQMSCTTYSNGQSAGQLRSPPNPA